jgi:hypothetical protein
MVVTQGHQLFAAELTRLAGEISDPRLSLIAASITAPLQVAVCGRRGVGRRTVAAALAAAGVRIVRGPGLKAAAADAAVYVVAEVVKPEDPTNVAAVQAMSFGRRRPVLVLLNKSDLSGHCGVADVAAATRAAAAPMSALFALAALDDHLDSGLWTVLDRIAAHPADLSSVDHFVSCPHPVPRQARERLCATLDLSGIERVLELARRGGTVTQARMLLRRLSGVDDVVAHLTALGAGEHQRRMLEAVARLEALAVGDGRIDEFLNRDATVAARMAAAAAAVQQQYVPGEPPLRRARRWHAYRSAPVGAIQRACAADIARGSLRSWSATRGRP